MWPWPGSRRQCFESLDPARAALAFRHILGAVPPGPLQDGLTLGDFELVRRKAELLSETRPAVLAAKVGVHAPLGFQVLAHKVSTLKVALRDAS